MTIIPGGNDTSCKLLMHADGTNASTSFPDSSGSAHTLTANGSAQVSTASPKFGTGSCLLNGTTDFVAVTVSLADFGVGTGDFTIDAWIKTTVATAETGRQRTIFTSGDVGVTTGAFALQIDTSGHLVLGMNISGAFTAISTSTGTVTDGSLHHVAASRSGTAVRTFIDGTADGSGTQAQSLGTPAFALIGASTTTTGRWSGNIDELRFSNIARWTATFTPPVAAYANDIAFSAVVFQ